MLAEIAIFGVVVGAVVGLFEVSTRPLGLCAGDLTDTAAIRAALNGPEASAVAAEFRRRGIVPRHDARQRPWTPGLTA
jgi:hypothetical protein